MIVVGDLDRSRGISGLQRIAFGLWKGGKGGGKFRTLRLLLDGLGSQIRV